MGKRKRTIACHSYEASFHEHIDIHGWTGKEPEGATASNQQLSVRKKKGCPARKQSDPFMFDSVTLIYWNL